MNTAVGAERKAHGVLGNSLRRIGRNTSDLHAKVLGNGNIDSIKASAAHKDQLDAKARQNLEGHGARIGIDERADGIIATGKGGRHRSEVGLDIINLDVGIALELLVEGILVVACGSVEENLHFKSPFGYQGADLTPPALRLNSIKQPNGRNEPTNGTYIMILIS